MRTAHTRRERDTHLVRYIVDYDDTISSSVIARCDSPESLLTCCVPLQKRRRRRDSHDNTPLGAAVGTTIDITVRDRKPHLIGWSMRITLDVT